MPIYEYECQKCTAEFEVLIRSEHDVPTCPECGSENVAKEFSVPAAHSPGGSLPMMGPGNCGRPQCGTGGGCAGLGN
jgi:putative FmdB family regulatory protein